MSLLEYAAGELSKDRGFSEAEDGPVLRPSQFTGQQEELVAQFLECQLLPRFFQAVPLKRSDQVVSKPNYFQL